MSAVDVSTKRTAVNVTIVLAVIGGLSSVFGWQLNINSPEQLWLAPVIGAITGIGYRLSRFATTRWPAVGWVLFGSGKEPVGMAPIKED